MLHEPFIMYVNEPSMLPSLVPCFTGSNHINFDLPLECDPITVDDNTDLTTTIISLFFMTIPRKSSPLGAIQVLRNAFFLEI